jgi:dTDP-4-dehydrorhamnose reductase
VRRVFLTGGNGFVGRRFREAHHHGFDILSTDVDELDILDKDGVRTALRLFKPDYVIHLAAIALTDYCNENPEKCRAINVTGAVNVAEACAEAGAKLVFVSSEQVFNGNEDGGPYAEDRQAVPNTVYGKNKLEAEGLIRGIIPEHWILRFTWMFGVPERNRPVVANILWDTVKAALAGTRTKVPTNEFRGMTYVGELIDQFDRVFDLPYGTYHTGAENPLDRYEVVRLILTEMGLSHRIDELVEKDDAKYATAARDVRLDTAKIRNEGFEFSETPDALRRCIREYGLGG